MTNQQSSDTLHEALAKSQQVQKRLHRLLWGLSALFALFISAFVANMSLWSFVVTLLIAFAAQSAVSIYRVSLMPVVFGLLVYAVIDNYLSTHGHIDQKHLMLEFAGLTIFTGLFSQATPHLMRLMSQMSDKP